MSDIGEVLRTARQEKGLSLSDVADATRIKAQYLEALEDGDYSLLPGPAYTTGFLKNYARFLGLQPDDMVQDFHAYRPAPVPHVKAATRVLASGYERQHRTRLLWGLGILAILLVAGYAIKQYDNSLAHAYSPQLNVTPANLGAPTPPQTRHRAAPQIVRLQLRATAPVWARVTVDGARSFQGLLRANSGPRMWVGHRAIYVATYDGAHIDVRFDGHPLGLMARQPGLSFYVATPGGWQRAS